MTPHSRQILFKETNGVNCS